MDSIAIIGAGAVGGVAAAALGELGKDVTLCVRRAFPRLTVEMDDRVHDVPAVIATDPAALHPVDWVLLATKAQDTPGAVPWLDRLVHADTTVVVLQNGIDQFERVRPLAQQGHVLPAIVYSPGEAIAPGHIRAKGAPRYVVPAGDIGTAFARLFAGSDVVELSADFVTATWVKFLANVSANPITALTMSPLRVLQDPNVRRLAEGIITEAVTVGRAAGAKIGDAHIERLVGSLATFDPEGGTSMYFDRMAGRPMEHEHITGALVRKAAELGIDVPLNSAVLALLRGLQASLQRPHG